MRDSNLINSEGIVKKKATSFTVATKPRDNTKGISIYFRLSYGGKTHDISTGIKCKKGEFKNGKVKGDEQANLLLSTYEQNLHTACNNLKIANQTIDLKRIGGFIFGDNASAAPPKLFEQMGIYVQKRWLDDGLTYDEKTKVKAIRYFAHLKSWMIECFGREDIEYNDIKPFHDQEIIKWVKTKTKILTDGHNHGVKHVQRLKGFFNYAIQNDWTTKNPFLTFKPKTKDKEIVSLSKMELSGLEKADLLEGTIYDLVRDLFVFSCYTGLGYADLKEVGFEHLKKDGNGNIFLEIPRLKNGQIATMLLREKPLELIEKYRLEDKQEKFFNVPTNQCMNDTIKQIAQIIGIKKVLTTHIARKTFGSLLKEDGMDIAIISKSMAHKNIATTMKHYANIQSTTIINAFLQLPKNQ